MRILLAILIALGCAAGALAEQLSLMPVADQGGETEGVGNPYHLCDPNDPVLPLSYDLADPQAAVPSRESRFALEFSLAEIPRKAQIDSARLVMFQSQLSFPSTPWVQLHGFAGDGAIDAADLQRNNPIGSPMLIAADVPYYVDVTPFTRGLVTSGASYAEFSVRLNQTGNFTWVPFPSSDYPNVDWSPRLLVSYRALPGDVNADGVVDHADLSLVAEWLGATNLEGMQGDLNGDGRVSMRDLAIVQASWTGPIAAGSLAVPEPSGFALAAIGMAAFVYRRCRSRITY